MLIETDIRPFIGAEVEFEILALSRGGICLTRKRRKLIYFQRLEAQAIGFVPEIFLVPAQNSQMAGDLKIWLKEKNGPRHPGFRS